jgi:O-antigen ligase
MVCGDQLAGQSVKKEFWTTAYNLVYRAAWAALLIALPVTSFPYFPSAIGGEALVRPLSLYPLLFLFPIAILPRLIRRPLPKNLLSLLPFVLVAVAVSALSLLRGIEPALGISVEPRVLRGIFTLAIGCGFFLTIALLPDTVRDLRFSLRWIYAGVSLALLWGSVQAIGILAHQPAFSAFLQKLQSRISIRPLQEGRISGMTYEPHWFAEQIILLLLPYTIAAVLNNYTVFRWRWRRLTFEWLLLVWAVVLINFTYSRAGLLNLVITIFLSVLLFRPRGRKHPVTTNKVKVPRLMRRGIGVLVAILLLITPIYLIGTKNPFFARIWGYWQRPDASLEGYLSYLGFDARLVYAQAAYNTYTAYPITGVGLGNYAFYFEEMLPYRPIGEVPEILFMTTPEMGRDRLITSKNFYLRIMAETGILGTITFMTFVLVNLGYALYLRLSPEKEWQYWGTASLCGLIAFALSALTFDSFVIPDMWVIFGLITAAIRIATHENQLTVPSNAYG